MDSSHYDLLCAMTNNNRQWVYDGFEGQIAFKSTANISTCKFSFPNALSAVGPILPYLGRPLTSLTFWQIRLNQLQGYFPQLRQQFLRDLDDIGKLSSPLHDDESFCPTNLASMVVAEYHIATNNLGLAYNHMVRAAKRSYDLACALVGQLEPYHGSFDRLIEIGNFPKDLVIKRSSSSVKPPTRAMKWSYSAACIGSTSALRLLREHDAASHADALQAFRFIQMGGAGLELWTRIDCLLSQEKGRMTAGPREDETALFRNLRAQEGVLGLPTWIVNLPLLGVNSTLHVVSAKGLVEPIEMLIDSGAEVNSQDFPGGYTPLLMACTSGSLGAVRKLLDNGADPTMGNKDGETPLHWLSMFEEEEIPIAAKLLFRHARQLSVVARGTCLDVEGAFHHLSMAPGTPLHRAIGRRSLPAVRSLLGLGADPLLVDQIDMTPIGLAAKLHLTDILELLHSRTTPWRPNQDHGPNLRLFNFAINDADPLALFMIHGDRWLENAEKTMLLLLRFGERLYGYGGEDSFLMNTIHVGNYRMAKVMLENGATKHMEKMDYEFGGTTAVMNAIEHGQRHIFVELLKHGASVDTQVLPASLRRPGKAIFFESKPDQSTLLHYCAEHGSDVFFVDELVARGVPVNQHDSEWNTAIFLALRIGHLHVASRLIHHGAHLSDIKDGLTLLGQLAEGGLGVSLERYQWLLDRSNKGSGTSGLLTSQRYRQSILHQIAQDERAVRQPTWARELLAFFIEGASDKRIVDLQDVRLNTALHLAVHAQNSEVANALLEAGARSDLVNMDGQTPLDIARGMDGAAEHRAKEMLQLLDRYRAAAAPTSVPTRAPDTDEYESAAMALWRELGMEEQLSRWLDTALVPILQALRQALLALFRSDGFLLQENPWKAVTRMVYDTVLVNQAILAKKERTRQFEYIVGELLRGFVDAVEVNPTSDGENVAIRLVKPVDGVPRLPPNVLLLDGDNITSMVLSPKIGRITFQHSYPGQSFSRNGQSQVSGSQTDGTMSKSAQDITEPQLESQPSKLPHLTLNNISTAYDPIL